MKALMALAVMLSSLAAVGVATTSPAEAHFNKKHHGHYKHYKHAKCHKHLWKHKKCHKH
jgi:hypothetical protein